MALHEVDLKDTYIKGDRHYCADMVNQFIESNMLAAEVDIAEGAEPHTFRSRIYCVIKRLGLKDTIKVRLIKNKVYLIKA